MAADAALGASFGAVFTVLYETVKEVVGKVRKFKPILVRLESSLNNMAPMVDEIRQLSEQLDLPEVKTKRLIERMEEGKKLVHKCLEIRWWNSCFKVGYATELKELDEEIRRFCQEYLQVLNTRNVLKTLEQVKHIGETVDSLRAKAGQPRSIFASLFSCFGFTILTARSEPGLP